MFNEEIDPEDLASGKVVQNKFGTFWFKEAGINILEDGTIVGKLHRDNDLPAAIWVSRDKGYYRNGLLHREGGPAFIYSNGDGSWWMNGVVQRKEN